MIEKIVLAAPRGFCAGVAYAIEVVDLALKIHGAPLYVRHAIVHNEWVVRSFEKQGVVFVEDVAEIPEGSVVVFSAHGVSPEVRRVARELGHGRQGQGLQRDTLQQSILQRQSEEGLVQADKEGRQHAQRGCDRLDNQRHSARFIESRTDCEH